jgi:hypothetical protein
MSKISILMTAFLFCAPAFSHGNTASLRKIASANPDCSASSVGYRKAPATYSNLILKQWACAAANEVPFTDRDTSPLVSACEKAKVLYRQVKTTGKKKFCIYLDDAAEESQDFLYVETRNGQLVPVYQSTKVPSED